MLYEDFKEEFLLKYTERSLSTVEELLDDALSYYGESKTFSKGGWDCFVSIAKEGELQHTYTLYLTYEDVDEGFDLTFENGINNGTVLEEYCFNCESDEEGGGEEEMVDKQTVEFNSGDMIYIAQINPLAGVSSQRYYSEQYWCDSGHQREYIKLGIAFKCKEDAERKTKELLGVVDESTNPYPSHAAQYREYHGSVAWLYNPWVGCKRDAMDIGTDVLGYGIVVGGVGIVMNKHKRSSVKSVDDFHWTAGNLTDDTHQFYLREFLWKKEGYNGALSELQKYTFPKNEPVLVYTVTLSTESPHPREIMNAYMKVDAYIKKHQSSSWVFSHIDEGEVDICTDIYDHYAEMALNIDVYATLKSNESVQSTEVFNHLYDNVVRALGDMEQAKLALESKIVFSRYGSVE